ncbi:MAG: hypothetical protein J0647_04185 [Campylobacteraceae bacterium]|nr:hypothetical protein [Campylobacteraceae bacterium]
MKNTNRQISPLGRSTKKNNAGLSLLRPKLFTVVGHTYKYFNEVFQNISKIISKSNPSFIFNFARLTQKKFKDFDMFISFHGFYTFSCSPKKTFNPCSWLIDPIYQRVNFSLITRY